MLAGGTLHRFSGQGGSFAGLAEMAGCDRGQDLQLELIASADRVPPQCLTGQGGGLGPFALRQAKPGPLDGMAVFRLAGQEFFGCGELTTGQQQIQARSGQNLGGEGGMLQVW
ncbi:hypothetical protein [Nakamurella sp. PAMC28650]|uniref:hypothetical protein n=1 Tax=Nakamurella sp. PAMC28650 TaxID=2762325 RepID=UPI00164E8780|nr:hypothetical protein [Nakamurella sp. PAMC28650]QNK82128.1 hypothetical protein H7F38_05070 [Nakamurella sp. PAMC28650]